MKRTTRFDKNKGDVTLQIILVWLVLILIPAAQEVTH